MKAEDPYSIREGPRQDREPGYIFSMVTLRERPVGGSGSGSGSGSGAGSEPVDDGLREFIASEITRGILEATPVIFRSIKEGIIELMEDRLRAFRSDLASGQASTRTLSFKDFRGSGAPDFHGVKDPIAARRWIADIKSAQLTSFCPEGSKVRFAAGCLRAELEIGGSQLETHWEPRSLSL